MVETNKQTNTKENRLSMELYLKVIDLGTRGYFPMQLYFPSLPTFSKNS